MKSDFRSVRCSFLFSPLELKKLKKTVFFRIENCVAGLSFVFFFEKLKKTVFFLELKTVLRVFVLFSFLRN